MIEDIESKQAKRDVPLHNNEPSKHLRIITSVPSPVLPNSHSVLRHTACESAANKIAQFIVHA